MAGTRSRRAWGWHPLTDEWATRIVADAGVRTNDLVMDIGAGHGALTAALLDAGARVVAVELHPGRIRHLQTRFATAPVTVVGADATTLCLPHRPYRVVASPPYAITSALLQRLLSRGSRLVSADLVLQRAAVHRYIDAWARPRHCWQRHWVLAAGCRLPRRAFRPPPQVDSAVLKIRRR